MDEAPSPEKNEDEAAAAAPIVTELTTTPPVLLADASGIHDDVGPTPDSSSKGNDKDNDDNEEEEEEEEEPPLESSDSDGRSSQRTPELAKGRATTPESVRGMRETEGFCGVAEKYSRSGGAWGGGARLPLTLRKYHL